MARSTCDDSRSNRCQMRRMKDDGIASMWIVADLHHSPRQISILTEISEALIEAINPSQKVAAIKHVSGHEPDAFKVDVGNGAVLGIAEFLGCECVLPDQRWDVRRSGVPLFPASRAPECSHRR